MAIPTEPIGSIPRPRLLLDGMKQFKANRISEGELHALQNAAVQDTVEQFEATGSPVITDGEQTKPSFATYPIDKLKNLDPDGIVIPFADGHTRQLPRLISGPFEYQTHAVTYLRAAKRYAQVGVKQAVIAPSALSLLYPPEGINHYPREGFIEDLVKESETDIRECLASGAHSVQIDFTEGRLSMKLDPSGKTLRSFIDLNNAVLRRFSESDRKRIGVHTCPGSDWESTHSLDVDYDDLLPSLFELEAGIFYIQLASEHDRQRVLNIIRRFAPVDRRIFVGVTDPIDPKVETPEEIRDRVLEAAEIIDPDRLGTCDDCGFSPFGDDTSTSREVAFAKIRARVEGTKLAEAALGLT